MYVPVMCVHKCNKYVWNGVFEIDWGLEKCEG